MAARTLNANDILEGPFPILVTPWTEDAKLDIPALIKEAEYVNAAGVGGLIWPSSPEINELEKTDEYSAGLMALAERSVKAREEFSARVTAVCSGDVAADGVRRAAMIESVAMKTGAKMAILARPADDVMDQVMMADYYRALAKVTTQPVIIQTFNDKSPQPDVELLVSLAKEFPDVYGYVKEESPGQQVNGRMTELLQHKEIKGVFSGWGAKGWVYQGSRIGTCGVISQRAEYTPLFVKIWKRLKAGADASDPELAQAYTAYLYMANLGDIFSENGDDEMRGPHLYVFERLGIFRNRLSRENGKVIHWEMSDKEKAEVDARMKFIGLLK